MKNYFFTLLVITCAIVIGCKDNTIKIQQKDSAIVHLPDSSNKNTHIQEEDSIKKDTFKAAPTQSKTIQNDSIVKNSKIDSTKYYIYFTLDDGPQPGTQNCVKILKENNIKATFFMVGSHNSGKERQNLTDSINNDTLFLVSNHSDTHARNKYQTFYKNPKSALQDFLTAESKLNIKHKIARLPGRNTWAINKKLKGESSAFAVAKKLDSIGYSVMGWDIEWNFLNGSTPVESADEMVKKVENALKYGKTFQPRTVVILVHDRMFEKPQHANSLRKFITTLKNNDQYIFETMDNYPVLTSNTP